MTELPARFATVVRTVADWLDDRMTIAAVGLVAGYFGLSDAQWQSVTGLIVAVASTALVLIPDPGKSKASADEPIPPKIVVDRAAAPDSGVRAPVSSDRELSAGPDDSGHNG